LGSSIFRVKRPATFAPKVLCDNSHSSEIGYDRYSFEPTAMSALQKEVFFRDVTNNAPSAIIST